MFKAKRIKIAFDGFIFISSERGPNISAVLKSISIAFAFRMFFKNQFVQKLVPINNYLIDNHISSSYLKQQFLFCLKRTRKKEFSTSMRVMVMLLIHHLLLPLHKLAGNNRTFVWLLSDNISSDSGHIR